MVSAATSGRSQVWIFRRSRERSVCVLDGTFQAFPLHWGDNLGKVRSWRSASIRAFVPLEMVRSAKRPRHTAARGLKQYSEAADEQRLQGRLRVALRQAGHIEWPDYDGGPHAPRRHS